MNRFALCLVPAFSVVLMLPQLALAHPDHPQTLGFADSFAHLFSSPYHLLMLLIPTVAALVCGRKILLWLNRHKD
jgi:hydrogenase/urease accessory protein HupE